MDSTDDSKRTPIECDQAADEAKALPKDEAKAPVPIEDAPPGDDLAEAADDLEAKADGDDMRHARLDKRLRGRL